MMLFLENIDSRFKARESEKEENKLKKSNVKKKKKEKKKSFASLHNEKRKYSK